MGARSVPHPAPGPGAAPGSIAATRPASARPASQPSETIRSRSPGRTLMPSAHSRTCRIPCRGSRSRPGGIDRTRRTTRSRSSSAATMANRMPNVWIDLVPSRRRAASAGRVGCPRSPRIRSRRVSGTSARRTRPREPSRRTSRTCARYRRPETSPRYLRARPDLLYRPQTDPGGTTVWRSSTSTIPQAAS